jgi:osmotically-inducible protein OsmY
VTAVSEEITNNEAASGTAVKADIEAALQRSASTDATNISVGVNKAQVTLVGTVSSWPEHAAVTSAAWNSPGVADVVDNLTMAWTEREYEDRPSTRQDVNDKLEWEPSVHANEIDVDSTNGVVTLFGNVCSHAEKLSADRAALRVRGVESLVRDLKVSLTQTHFRSDDDTWR